MRKMLICRFLGPACLLWSVAGMCAVQASSGITDALVTPVAVSTAQTAVVEEEAASLLDDYAVNRWQVEDGLPSDLVLALQASSDGYLWCLTDKALSRFDGLRFETVNWRRDDAGNGWTGLDETEKATLWAYGPSGVIGFGETTMSKPLWGRTPKPPIAAVARVMKVPKDKAIWVAGDQGLYQVDGGNTRFYGLPKGSKGAPLVLTAADMAADGQIWLSAGPNVFRFSRGKFTRVTGMEDDITSLSIGYGGAIWMATSTNLQVSQGNQWRKIPAPPHRSHLRWRITALLAVDADEVWVGATSGLYRWYRGEWSALSTRDGFYPLEIQYLARDAEGHLWVGSNGGLLRLKRKVVQVFDSGLFLRRHPFTAVLPDHEVEMLAGVAGGGLLEGKPGAFRSSALAPIPGAAVVSALLRSKDGALWVGTQGDFLWRCMDGQSECIAETPNDQVSAVNINALLEDRTGKIWVGTGNGVLLYNPDQAQLEIGAGIPSGVRVHAIVEDGEGAVWIGLQGEGLVRVKDGAVTVYRQPQGLPSDTVMSLCVDADGILWAGTATGLGRWDGTQWMSITERQGLPEGPILQLQDEGPNLWMGTRYGIVCVSLDELADVASGRKASLILRSFGGNEGMRDEQCSGGFGNLSARDGSGRLWFSTLDGLVMVDPKGLPAKGFGGCRTYIDEVRVGSDIVLSMNSGLEHGPVKFVVPSGGARVSIRYSAPYFAAPDQVQFKRMLEGYDQGWSSVTASRSIVYSKLSPGSYRFRVMGGVSGVWRESVQTVDFVVLPAFWQRGWFWIVVGGMALALAGLIARRIERRRTRLRFLQLEREQALDRERSRIAHDLHDDLGASLTEIGLLSAVAQRPQVTPERARHYLGEIAEKIRLMVDTLDEIVWAINPRNDTVASLGGYFCEYAQRMLQLASIRCHLDLSPSLPAHPLDPNRRHNLFLAFNEALNNVIKHSGATLVTVRITGTDRALTVEVEDNGRGLPGGALSQGAEGLNSMRKRLERMSGTCEIVSRDGQGTTVRFIVPLE